MIRKHVSEPWYTFLRTGVKRVEGRLNTGTFATLNAGDLITFVHGADAFTICIRHIRKYPTFREYLETETLAACLPGVPTIEEGLAVYRQFYTSAEEAMWGIVALHLSPAPVTTIAPEATRSQ